jgi:nucleotide-binding universal stress UspA family protein
MIAKDVAKSLVILTSDYCNEAVDEVIKLASSSISKTKVYLKYLEDTDPSMDLFLKKEDFDEKKGRAHEICDKQSKRIIYAGLDVEVLKPYFGIASEEILRVEKQLGLDIIIIAAPKRSIWRRVLRGLHFSYEIAHKAMTPTLIVEPSSARRILVACPQ